MARYGHYITVSFINDLRRDATLVSYFTPWNIQDVSFDVVGWSGYVAVCAFFVTWHS